MYNFFIPILYRTKQTKEFLLRQMSGPVKLINFFCWKQKEYSDVSYSPKIY